MPARLPLLLLAVASLLAGLWGGLLRMSWPLPLPTSHANWITFHGPILVGGFFGTLIGIERALALRRLWAWAAPVLTAAGAVLVGAGALGPLAPSLVTAGAAVLLAATVVLGRRQPGAPMYLMAAGAAAWVAGNLVWLDGRGIPRCIVWWGAFFVLTIAGERLELARIRPPSRTAAWLLVGACALLLLGAAVSLIAPAAGERLAAAACVALAAWLLRHDVARLTVRSSGLPRFSAVALLSAYAWLAVAGVALFAEAPLDQGLGYDGAVHALFVGFVFSMVFGHAPIVLAAVLGGPPRYHRVLYVPLLLLDVSLLLRIGADHATWHAGRRWGGLLGAIAILAFAVQSVWLRARARR